MLLTFWEKLKSRVQARNVGNIEAIANIEINIILD